MKRDLDLLVAPLIALLLLALIVQQTLGALRASGAWGRRPAPEAAARDPYAALDRALAPADTTGVPARDPFAFVAAPAPVIARRPPPVGSPTTAPAPEVPVLTSIVFDADPQATIRYHGTDYSVRASSLFADFRVVRIARDQVILDRSGETLVLKLPVKGD